MTSVSRWRQQRVIAANCNTVEIHRPLPVILTKEGYPRRGECYQKPLFRAPCQSAGTARYMCLRNANFPWRQIYPSLHRIFDQLYLDSGKQVQNPNPTSCPPPKSLIPLHRTPQHSRTMQITQKRKDGRVQQKIRCVVRHRRVVALQHSCHQFIGRLRR